MPHKSGRLLVNRDRYLSLAQQSAGLKDGAPMPGTEGPPETGELALNFFRAPLLTVILTIDLTRPQRLDIISVAPKSIWAMINVPNQRSSMIHLFVDLGTA